MSILFNTKLRKKLLAYLFAHTKEELYVRQLAYATHLDPGNVSRELRLFEAEGLIVSSRKGSLKLYRLNEKYPLYEEFKQIVLKTEGVVAALKECVNAIDEISFSYIYGSFAKNQEDKVSDIDLMVVAQDLSLKDFTKRIKDLESRIDREINFSPYSPQEYYREKAKKGGFLQMVHKGLKIILKNEKA